MGDWLMSPPPLAAMHAAEGAETYRNDTFQVVLVRLKCGLIHLSVKRFDQEPIHSWRDLQAIKNALVGDEREAAEIYPAESRLVDTANIYHLWALPEGERFPFGFDRRNVGARE